MTGEQREHQTDGHSRSHQRACVAHKGSQQLKRNKIDRVAGPTIRRRRATGISEPLGSNQPGAGTRGFRVLVPVPGGTPGGTGVVSAHLFTMILDALPDEWDSPPAA